MQLRNFTEAGPALSLLGFGTMRLPVKGKNQSDIDEEKALEMIDCAYESGVNYFDTAHMYHDQASEPFIGKALSRYRRETFHLATKMPPWNLKSKGDAERVFDGQLKKCGVDYFDFYLMHCITRETFPTFEKYGVYEFLLEQQKKGKLRRLGFSLHDNNELLKQVVAKWDFQFALMQMNYFDWDGQNAKELHQTLAGRNIPIFVMEPVRGGMLASLSPESAKVLQEADPTHSIASWAMRFAAGLPGVVTVLSGMTTLDQVKDNVATYKNFTPLTPTEQEAIVKAVDIYRKSGAVPCTACRYCVPCPVGVDIPHAFAVYNAFKKQGSAGTFRMHYEMIGDGSLPENCTSCGQCLPLCPQHLDIPALMGQIAKAYENPKG